MEAWQEIGLLLAIAFLPPLAYLVWIRNLEKVEREPWTQLGRAFLWGMTGAVVLAVALSLALAAGLEPAWELVGLAIPFSAVTTVVIAPLVEEPAKVVGLGFVRDPVPEPEDGLIYGAAVGLGFSATENLLYAYDALVTDGVEGLVVVASIRAVAAAFLHASASALAGYGWLSARGAVARFSFVGLAVLLHGTYNGLLSTEAVLAPFIADAVLFALVGFAFALGLSIVVFWRIRRHVVRMDARPPPG